MFQAFATQTILTRRKKLDASGPEHNVHGSVTNLRAKVTSNAGTARHIRNVFESSGAIDER